MGLFNKRPKTERRIAGVYSLVEAKNFISRNPGFSAEKVEGGFIIIPDSEARRRIDSMKRQPRDFRRGIQVKNVGYIGQDPEEGTRNPCSFYG